jgi:hypothetical protein
MLQQVAIAARPNERLSVTPVIFAAIGSNIHRCCCNAIIMAMFNACANSSDAFAASPSSREPNGSHDDFMKPGKVRSMTVRLPDWIDAQAQPKKFRFLQKDQAAPHIGR